MNFSQVVHEHRITSDNTQLSLSKMDMLENGLSSTGDEILQSIATVSPAVSDYITAALADNTRRAYRQDLKDFQRWGGFVPCSTEILAAYIAERAESLSTHSITRRVVGISRAHVSQGFPDPAKTDLIRTLLRGIRRKHGKPQRQVAPLIKQYLFEILPRMQGMKSLRDRALILLGFAAALRRSELVALDYTDLSFVNEGLIVQIRKSKTDQEGEGRKIGIPYGRSSACPVKAVQQWLELSQITSGPIFRSVNKAGNVNNERLTAQSVALVIKDYTGKMGLPATNFSGHSLRSGLATSAAHAGVPAHKIQQQTGHRSVEMLNRYIHDASLFENNAAGIL